MVVRGQRTGNREAKKTPENLSLDFGDQPLAKPELRQVHGRQPKQDRRRNYDCTRLCLDNMRNGITGHHSWAAVKVGNFSHFENVILVMFL